MKGVVEKDKSTMEAQLKKLNVLAGEIFERNTGLLLSWSVVNDINILDCVVTIDFCEAPPSFSVKEASDFLLTNNCGMRSGEPLYEVAKKDIERNRAASSITAVIIAFPAGGAGRNGSLVAYQLGFPGNHLVIGSWKAAQDGMRNDMIQRGWCKGLPFPIS